MYMHVIVFRYTQLLVIFSQNILLVHLICEYDKVHDLKTNSQEYLMPLITKRMDVLSSFTRMVNVYSDCALGYIYCPSARRHQHSTNPCMLSITDTSEHVHSLQLQFVILQSRAVFCISQP